MAGLDLDFVDEEAPIDVLDVVPGEGLDVGEAQPGIAGEEEGAPRGVVGTGGGGEEMDFVGGEAGTGRDDDARQECRIGWHGVVGDEAYSGGMGEDGMEALQVGAGTVGPHSACKEECELPAEVGVDIGESDVGAGKGFEVDEQGVTDVTGVLTVGLLPHVSELGDGGGVMAALGAGLNFTFVHVTSFFKFLHEVLFYIVIFTF